MPYYDKINVRTDNRGYDFLSQSGINLGGGMIPGMVSPLQKYFTNNQNGFINQLREASKANTNAFGQQYYSQPNTFSSIATSNLADTLSRRSNMITNITNKVPNSIANYYQSYIAGTQQRFNTVFNPDSITAPNTQANFFDYAGLASQGIGAGVSAYNYYNQPKG